MNKKFRKILDNYADESSSSEEREVVDILFKKLQEGGVTKNDIEKDKVLKAKILKEILRHTNKKKRTFRWAYAAAVVAGFIGLTFVLRNEFPNSDNKLETETNIVKSSSKNITPGTSKAVLTLHDGTQVALTKGQEYNTNQANSTGEHIIYNNRSSISKDIAFNSLTVPRGGMFSITLSDGTVVTLNSETQIKYPVAFTKGKTREVELVYGEAYFDVSPSTANNGTKFKVLNASQEIEVLGTEFNFSAYEGEKNIKTTLVEGKVAVYYNGKSEYLLPNKQSNLNINTHNITIEEVNVADITSWMQGVFNFRGTNLKEIMKVISRWYDVDVVFQNKDLENITFRGVLGKDKNLEDILETIKSLSVIKTYKINDKTIILE